MSFFLTFVSKQLSLETVLRLLQNKSIEITREPVWLSESYALDVPISRPLQKEDVDGLRALLPQTDVFFTKAENRRKKLLLADMDSTIVDAETLDELAAFAGVGRQVEEITKKSMAGEVNFEESLERRVKLLEGLPITEMQKVLGQCKINPGAKELIRMSKENGARCILVSGGFTFYTGEIRTECGFDRGYSNDLDVYDGRLTGRIKGSILGPDTKYEIMCMEAKECSLSLDDVVAVGDGANDLPMLKAAGVGIGYYPKNILKQSLVNVIECTDLRSVLYAQGYQV